MQKELLKTNNLLRVWSRDLIVEDGDLSHFALTYLICNAILASCFQDF